MATRSSLGYYWYLVYTPPLFPLLQIYIINCYGQSNYLLNMLLIRCKPEISKGRVIHGQYIHIDSLTVSVKHKNVYTTRNDVYGCQMYLRRLSSNPYPIIALAKGECASGVFASCTLSSSRAKRRPYSIYLVGKNQL